MSLAPTVVGTDGLDAEFAVHLSARWIVDASDHAFDFEHALGDESGHDVAVVAVGDGDEAVGRRRAGTLEHVEVDTGADHDVAFEFLTETLECGCVFVDDDDFVPVGV